MVELVESLPDALRDVIEHGDDFARNAALRLVLYNSCFFTYKKRLLILLSSGGGYC